MKMAPEGPGVERRKLQCDFRGWSRLVGRMGDAEEGATRVCRHLIRC